MPTLSGSLKRRTQARQPVAVTQRRGSPTARSASPTPSHSLSACLRPVVTALCIGAADHLSKPATSPSSALERVSRDVRVFILQWLDGRHKLTAVSRLSRSFRALHALAVRHECIAALMQGTVEVHRAERAASGQLSSLDLHVRKPEQPGRSTLFTCPRSLRSLPHLSALGRLSIDMWLSDLSEAAVSLRCILRSALSLPSLTALHINALRHAYYDEPVPEADWTDDALPTPSSLRYLVLARLSLSAASVHRLCSLPLVMLMLHSCPLQAGDDAAPVNAALPSVCTLQHLEVMGLLRCELFSTVASHARQLQQLNFMLSAVDLGSGPAWDFSSLMTESGAPRLPHLTKLSLPRTFHGSTSRPRQPGLEQACTTASQQLVAAYCAQLTSLYVSVPSAASLSSWLRLLFGRCHRLDDLSIVADELAHDSTKQPQEPLFEPVEAGDALTLPRLYRLTLTGLPLTDGDLLSVLSRCPELELCMLRQLTLVTAAGREAALRCCPKFNEQCSSLWTASWHDVP